MSRFCTAQRVVLMSTIPHTQYLFILTESSGELDYHTLGNMITATIMGEVREERNC